jgi:UDP-2,3-diacylglucosamine hydrolase
MKTTVFFSDTHLEREGGKRTRLLCRFLDSLTDAQAVYILGDLFDYWVGPAQLQMMKCEEVLEKLRALSNRGVKVYLLQGNRDFLLGKAEEKLLNVSVLGDAVSISLGQKSVYLAHGDLFCTNDKDYLLLRHILRFKPFQILFKLLIPSALKLLLARAARRSSSEIVRRKAAKTKGVNPAAVLRIFSRGYDVVVCGHIHEPRQVSYTVGTRKCTLFVLGDWSSEGSYVQYCDGVFSLKRFANELPAS